MTFKGTLLDFQTEAVEFMLERQTVLLAHTLGLGKTVTSIATIETLIDEGEIQCVLVVCPASVKYQWKRMIDRFTDGALVMVIEGTKAQRQTQYRKIHQGQTEYVLMNYEQIVNDWDIVRLLDFDAIVADEVQAIKNPRAKRSRFIKRIKAEWRFGLTGQPIENKPEEAFSIMQWVDPDVLGRYDIFDRTFISRNRFGGVKMYRNLKMFRELMAGVMHRRTRAEISDQLPAVVEESYLIDLDDKSQRVYNVIARELVAIIRGGGVRFSSFDVWNHYSGLGQTDASGYAEIMPRIMALRMLCDHPDLLKLSASYFDDPDTKMGSEYAATLRDNGLLEGVNKSAKLTVTVELIDEILEADPANKVVLFSFFKPMLGLLWNEVNKKYHSVTFTGDFTARQRDTAIQEFQNNPDCRVFLSSDAGGVGVDLPQANYLISYDLPWSAGKWEQRNGRIIRLSSKWPHVTLLSMLMRDTTDEWMYGVLETKGKVAGAWLDGKGLDSAGRFEVALGNLADFLESRL